MIIETLYEDKDLVVIGKPTGVVVNRAESVKTETIQDWVEANLTLYLSGTTPDDDTFIQRSGIVHRIDKETSGLLIISKNQLAFRALQAQFKERTVHKTYIALVHDKISVDEGQINAPIERSPFNRQKFMASASGKASITRYKVLAHYELGKQIYCLIEVYPKTGRTHQIRVHFKHFGNVLVSDQKYAGRKRYKKDIVWCPRLFLHAARIQFTQPANHKVITVEQKLPEDLQKALAKLNKYDL